MIVIKEILCPVDLSPVSRHAFAHAVALAQWYDARIHVLHVYTVLIPATVPPFAFAGPVAGPAPEPDLESVNEDIADLIARPRQEGLAIDVTVLDGIPAQRITEHARAFAVDLIVMGTHGHGRLERMLLGSVAERVIRTTPAPLLTVPPPCAHEPTARFTNILCCVDFSRPSESALRFGFSLAQESGGRITLLHVVDWPEEDEPMTSRWCNVPEYRLERQLDAEQRLRALVPADVRDWCDPITIVRPGRPYRTILAVAADIGADLVLMGSHGRTAIERLFVGSTANHVIRSASCPVLTIGKSA